MDSISGSTDLDWDLDIELEDYHYALGKTDIAFPTRARSPDGLDMDHTLANSVLLGSPRLTLPDTSDSTTYSDEEDNIVLFESDEEEVQRAGDVNESVVNIRERTIIGLENLVLSFLEQLDTDKIELTLANRIKTKENGSSAQRVLFWPKKAIKGSFIGFARLFRIIDIIHEALTNDTPTTKRDIFYKDVPLFKTQSVVDGLVDDLAATLQVSRGDLNVRASPKGLFSGSGLSIYLKRSGVVHGNDSEGALIPARADVSHLQVTGTISWVLVVEKEAVFQTLCKAGFTSHPRCPGPGIIITGKGYPDMATRELVSQLSITLPASVPLLALVDADAYGLDILSVYKFGSQSLSHEGLKMTSPRIIWLGLWGSELTSFGIDRDEFIPLTKHDHKKALEMLRRDETVLPIQWRKEISYMLHFRRKAEIEVISSATRYASQPDASQRPALRDIFGPNNLIALDPPLVQYLISKLNFWVNAPS